MPCIIVLGQFQSGSHLSVRNNSQKIYLVITETFLILLCILIVIAVSSPHRKEAFVACEQILEEVKRKAQIWKREYYEGEDESTAEWK